MADWFNNELSGYVDKKEKILIDVRKNNKICRILSIISALFIALLASCFITIFTMVVGAAAADKDPNFTGCFLLAVCVFICSYLLFACLIYNSQRSIRYVLTNCGIYVITGMIFKDVKFVAYNQITDISMSIGPIQRIFGAGSVGVGTASGNVVGSVSEGKGSIYSIDEMSIDSVDNYKKIKEIIIKNIKK